ncbi:MAG TPA: PASTA domain-containing protein [Acidimicrobiia bacterium]|jgi:serine/threonine-protein kinase|nr:PASTA domain-containing protein [Acidimicrobiia bacterium]
MATNGANDLAGRVLAGRYRLLAPIGTGASGRVYAAEDIRLKRRVAVKVLHAALAEDAGFLRRFRAEAQVAASLHHPNIMAVYDWGEDEQPFMVVELLEGGSLRGLLDRGTHLSIPQAARIGRDVAAALDYAHSRGIVHRDIKPANLLFDEHGSVRIADFGLARALAEASWTEPSGAVFGTARYASPEQARGVQLDARSDLYSLALVLVESVTGSIPFAADTTIGTLAARTQQPIVAPAELGPLQAPIERAGQLDPATRYPDAATMESALTDVVEAVPRPEPLELPGIADSSDPHPTTAVARAATAALFDQDTAATEAIAVDFQPIGATHTVRGRLGLPPRTDKQRSRQRRLVPLAVLVAFAVATALSTSALAKVGASGRAAPGLVGLMRDKAEQTASGADFQVHVEQRASADPSGVVVSQDPAPGSWFYGGGTINVVVSSGPAPVTVPPVLNLQTATAVAKLRAAGFTTTVVKGYRQNTKKGLIYQQRPVQNQTLTPGRPVTIWESQGPAPVQIPDLHGLTCAQATTQLTSSHLVPTCTQVFDDLTPKDVVVGTTPGVGATVNQGTPITINVSKGPELVTVPRVIGKTVASAKAKLQNLGFVVHVDLALYSPSAHVFDQLPEPGTRAPKGSTVLLIL